MFPCRGESAGKVLCPVYQTKDQQTGGAKSQRTEEYRVIRTGERTAVLPELRATIRTAEQNLRVMDSLQKLRLKEPQKTLQTPAAV